MFNNRRERERRSEPRAQCAGRISWRTDGGGTGGWGAGSATGRGRASPLWPRSAANPRSAKRSI